MQTVKKNIGMKTSRQYVLWLIFAAWMLAIFAVIFILEHYK